ncbi:MAG: tRNA pseudouridine(55) synthase TruB [Erysipelotrichaceae bacterium]|nr:tRNA pseudouridine(55) synthase TruB [Erysipelotrichaceae bacterium]
MDGIVLINKEEGLTSRDVVNKIVKKLNLKKVGHAGTLDPIAKGLLVIGIGKGTKILDLLTMNTKEYIATSKIGIETDTLDISGNILNKTNDFSLKREELINTLNSFIGSYYQEVPKYSAVKINGKKLYEYARNDLNVDLPKRLITIYKIELLEFNKNEFTFKVLASKGTYIRSLIRDIGIKLKLPMTMKELIRTKSGKFNLSDSYEISDDFKIIPIFEALDYPVIKITDENLLKKIKNGNKIKLDCSYDTITLIDNLNNTLAIYKKEKLEYQAIKVF